jgi:hypothetical protein
MELNAFLLALQECIRMLLNAKFVLIHAKLAQTQEQIAHHAIIHTISILILATKIVQSLLIRIKENAQYA